MSERAGAQKPWPERLTDDIIELSALDLKTSYKGKKKPSFKQFKEEVILIAEKHALDKEKELTESSAHGKVDVKMFKIVYDTSICLLRKGDKELEGTIREAYNDL